MADDLVSMSDQFSGLPMGDLIGGPMQAACDAQSLLAKASATFIKDIGMNEVSEGQFEARTVDFSFERPTQQEDGTVVQELVDLKVPILALVNVPALSVKECEVKFTMEVKSSTSHKDSRDTEASVDASASGGWGPFKASVTVHGSVSTHSENTRTSDNSAKYDVRVIARDDGPPEGLMRVLDMLNSAVAPTGTSNVGGGDGG